MDIDKIIPIHMGDDSQIISKGRGVVNLENGFFFNALYVPSLSSNMLSVYQMKHTGVPKQVNFSPNDVEIIDIAFGKLVTIGIENHHAKAYDFSQFVVDAKPNALLTHGNEINRLWNEIFGHFNFKYLW